MSVSPLPSPSAAGHFLRMRLAPSFRALALAVSLAACGRGGDANVDVNMSGPARGPDDLAITTTSGGMTLAVRADSMRMRLADSMRNKVTAELRTDNADTGAGFGAWIARKAKSVAADGMNLEMSVPIADVEKATVENGRIVLTFRSGVANPFEGTKVDKTPLLEAFSAADAEKFVAMVRAKLRK